MKEEKEDLAKKQRKPEAKRENRRFERATGESGGPGFHPGDADKSRGL